MLCAPAAVSLGMARAGAPGTVCCVLGSTPREALAKACSLPIFLQVSPLEFFAVSFKEDK